jgi:hypothetical protein
MTTKSLFTVTTTTRNGRTLTREILATDVVSASKASRRGKSWTRLFGDGTGACCYELTSGATVRVALSA